MNKVLMIFGMLMLSVAPLSAQPKVTLLPPKPGTIDNMSVVAAHQSCFVTLSEVHQMLAFCHDRTFADAHVSLVKLDAKGLPAAYVIPFKTPRADSLAKFANYALGAAFHPKLPLLYVWQDIAVSYTNPPSNEPPDLKNFDHLVIFDIAKNPPEMVASLCRGTEFVYGQAGGAVAVDESGSYLYVPNMRELKNAGSLRLGRFHLDTGGLPLFDDKDAKLPLPARVKRLTEVNAAKPLSPQDVTPVEYVNLFPLNAFGTGYSFIPIGKETVISSGIHGLMSWRPDDKNATLSGLPLKYSGHTLVGIHPNLPVLFATTYYTNTDSFFRVAQFEGYLSLLPRQYMLPEAKFSGTPAVLSKANKLAVGGEQCVYLFTLDDKGFPRPEAIRTPVLNPMTKALVYSQKFDRLYVGVDVSK